MRRVLIRTAPAALLASLAMMSTPFAQRPADRARDVVAGPLHDELVLAVHHVRPLLLGAGGGNHHGRRAGRDHVADFGPGEVFEEDAVRSFSRWRGFRSVRRSLRAHRSERQDNKSSE